MYACTKAYIRDFMPNTIHPFVDFEEHNMGLPHLKTQLKLFEMLLQYHDIEMFQHLHSYDITPECFATGWIVTNFARVVNFELIHEFIDIVIYE